MMTTIVVLVSVLLVTMTLHEAAHALALRGIGIPISQAGIGLPFPPLLKVKSRRLPFVLTFSPWVVGAYVMPHPDYHKKIDGLPYRTRAWFLNAGIVANLLAASVFTAAGFAAAGRPAGFLLAVGAAVVTWFGRKPIAAFVLPALALPSLALVCYALVNSWSEGRTGVGYAGIVDMAPTGVADYLIFSGVVNFAVAAMNTLPLFGLDNGKVVGGLVQHWAGARVARYYQAVGLTFVGLTVLAAIGSDLWALGSALIGR
jgi:membrane-associated protease RseP (regulator of RpoE activity)